MFAKKKIVLLSTHNRGMGGTSGRRRGSATVGAAIAVSGGCAARRWAARATAAGCPVSRQRRRGVVVVVRVRVHGRCVFGVLRVHVSYECKDEERTVVSPWWLEFNSRSCLVVFLFTALSHALTAGYSYSPEWSQFFFPLASTAVHHCDAAIGLFDLINI
jgi:hypothetical protein